MAEPFRFVLDGREVAAEPGQTILEAADAAGVYIPRLCHMDGLKPFGGCRICTVEANGRLVSSCTHPVGQGMVIETDTEVLQAHRKLLVEMLFVEGNHFCMSCEKSGNCELQALAYRFGISAPRFEYLFPKRDVDASHPDMLLDRDRCVLCSRCVRASQDVDGKHALDFLGRGPCKKIVASDGEKLADTDLSADDRAAEACPVGALLRKRVGFAVPIGSRKYDHEPIGSVADDCMADDQSGGAE